MTCSKKVQALVKEAMSMKKVADEIRSSDKVNLFFGKVD